jgi:hypothetical protein
MWLIFFLISSTGCAYLVTQSIIGYLEYETVTKITIIKEIPTEFPAISLFGLIGIIFKT